MSDSLRSLRWFGLSLFAAIGSATAAHHGGVAFAILFGWVSLVALITSATRQEIDTRDDEA